MKIAVLAILTLMGYTVADVNDSSPLTAASVQVAQARKKLPDWLFEQYGAPARPARKHDRKPTVLYRDPPDTQQGRDVLSGPAMRSARKRVDPAVLNSLPSLPGSIAPVDRRRPAHVEGKRVFTDQQEWEKIVGEAGENTTAITFKKAFNKARNAGKSEFSYKGDRFTTQKEGETAEQWLTIVKKSGNFKQAFDDARSAGEKVFEYQGKQFNTRRKNETEEHWKTVLETNIAKSIPAENPREHLRRRLNLSAQEQGVNPLVEAEIRDTDDQQAVVKHDFTSTMTKLGVSTAKEYKIDASKISDRMIPALEKLVPILKAAGIKPEITSGKRNKGYWSLHEIGEAFDLRLKNAEPKALKKLKGALPGNAYTTYHDGNKGIGWSEPGWDYILHGEGDNIHLHVERETDEAKQRLIRHMIKTGRAEKIPPKKKDQFAALIKNLGAKIPEVS